MATQTGELSVSISDADGNRKSFVTYVKYDDSTATLTSLAAAIAVVVDDLDAITDGKIIGASFAIKVTLPETLKSAAAVGSNVQETGLLNFVTDGPGGFTYSQDIPAFAQAALTGKEVNNTVQAVEDWIDLMANTGATFRHHDNRFAGALVAYVKGRKTFRK